MNEQTKNNYPDLWKSLEVKPENSNEKWYFRKNMGISEFTNKNKYQTLVYFTISFTPIDDSGLPSNKVAQILYDFEEKVLPIIEQKASCLFVASVLKSGIKDHLLYVSDPELFLLILSKYDSSLSNLGISLEKEYDPKWEIYGEFPDGT